MMRIALSVATALAALLIATNADAQTTAKTPNSAPAVALQGAGATFPAPLYKKWIAAYQQENPSTAIQYAAVGSGEGVSRFLANSVDFGASDSALSDEQLRMAKNGARMIPVTAGIVALAYNLPGLNAPLKLSRAAYADIFLGRVTKWNDPRIKALNPGLDLPDRSIGVVARQDSSGTTFAFTNHLSAISTTWRDQGPGVGKVVDWPGGAMLARGNEGVASRIKISEGSIGYVEYGIAKRLNVAVARLENKAGKFVPPSEEGGALALETNVRDMPGNLRVYLPDPEGEKSYPIVTYSWLIVHERYADPEKRAALRKFVAWGLTKGQAYSVELGYIPLPAVIADLALAAVDGSQ